MARPVETNGTEARRPRVVVLGGGFAGIGAARALKDAEADVVLVDEHDYHTFQPLLYQLATDLLATAVVGHPLRDLFHEQPNVAVHQDAVTSVDLARREVEFAEMAPLTYDYLVLGLGARVNFFGTEGAPEHAFPMYTLADAVRLKEHVLRKWEAADKDPSLVDDGALNVVVVGGGPTGVESAGALAELYTGDFAADYPSRAAGEGARHAGRGRPGAPHDVQEGHPGVHEEGAGGARRRHRPGRDRRVGLADPRHAQVREGAQGAHARLGRGLAGEPDRRRARSRAGEGQPGRRRPGSLDRGASGGLRRRRHRVDHRLEDEACPPAAGLGGAPGRRAGGSEHRAADRGREDRAVRLPRQGHDGDHRPRCGRGAVPPRPDAEGQDRVARVGHRPSGAPLHGRGPRQGHGRVELGGLHARATRPDHRADGRRTDGGRRHRRPSSPSSASAATSRCSRRPRARSASSSGAGSRPTAGS